MRVPGCIAALLTFAGSIAFAQTPEQYSGRPVAEVRVFVERQPIDDPVITELLETRPGTPLSLAAVRETISHLHTLGRYQDIQVEAIERAGGVL